MANRKIIILCCNKESFVVVTLQGHNTKGGLNGHSNHDDRRVNVSSLVTLQSPYRYVGSIYS